MLPEDLEKLVKSYKSVVQLELGEEFPEDPKAQLWGAVGAVFNSWMNQRAKTYRHLVIQRFKLVKILQERTKPYTPLKDTCVKLEESWMIWFPLTHAILFGVGDESSQGSLCIGRVSLLNVRVST